MKTTYHKFYSEAAMARQLGRTPQAVSNWRRQFGDTLPKPVATRVSSNGKTWRYYAAYQRGEWDQWLSWFTSRHNDSRAQ